MDQHTHPEIARLLQSDGFVLRREHPELADALERLCRRGSLARVLPGAYLPNELAANPFVRMGVLSRWAPDAVLVGKAAAKLTFWPTIRLEAIGFALRGRRAQQIGFVQSYRSIDPTLIRSLDGMRLSCSALTVLDLIEEFGTAEPIDTAFRTGATTVAQLTRVLALTRYRHGNRRRTELVLDSRDEPWSAAERLLHRILRAAGISGWRANAAVLIGNQKYYLDVAFRKIKLGLEIDGFEFHTQRGAFESDRKRQNALVLDGWLILRFTWTMLKEQPEQVLAQIVAAIERGKMSPR